MVSRKERQLPMARIAIILVLVFTGHVLLVSECVDAAPMDVGARHALAVAVSDAAHGDACVHDLASIVPAPNRPSLGHAVLPAIPVIAGAVPPAAIDAPPPDYPRAMARALLQVYLI